MRAEFRPGAGAPRAVVLGASGHLGNAITRELISRGYEVTAARLGQGPSPNLEGLAVKTKSGDHAEHGTLERWIEGHDLVIDAATPYSIEMDSSGRSVRKARDRGERVIDACLSQGARLAHISSFVTARQDTGFEKLEDRLPGIHAYFRIKRHLELQIDTAIARGLSASVVRPTLCVGPWDQKPMARCLIPTVLTQPVPAYSPHLLNVIDVREVALAVVSAMEMERPPSRLEVVGRNISMDQLYRFIMDVGERHVPMVGVPLPELLRLAALPAVGELGRLRGEILLLALLVGRHRPMHPSADQVEMGAYPRPLSRSLTDAVQWYRRIGYC